MTEAERRARNEEVFREVNERIQELSPSEPGMVGEFLCECSDRTCTTVLRVPVAEYERVRGSGARFIVAPGHVDAEIEQVAERHGDWFMVEKVGASGLHATLVHPRRRAS